MTKIMTDYERGEWDMFDLITSTWYGKQYYFLEKNGFVYSRKSCEYLTKEEAYDEFIGGVIAWGE